MNIIIKWYDGYIPKDAKLIRKAVFIEEQGYSDKQEFDFLDNKSNTLHIVIYLNNLPVATARLYFKSDGKVAIFGRICILKTFRNKKLGAVLMENLISKAKNCHAECCHLSSQEYAVPFYEKFGFSAYGKSYMDGHIPHRDMTLNFLQNKKHL